jgi:hypothetical protein
LPESCIAKARFEYRRQFDQHDGAWRLSAAIRKLLTPEQARLAAIGAAQQNAKKK